MATFHWTDGSGSDIGFTHNGLSGIATNFGIQGWYGEGTNWTLGVSPNDEGHPLQFDLHDQRDDTHFTGEFPGDGTLTLATATQLLEPLVDGIFEYAPPAITAVSMIFIALWITKKAIKFFTRDGGRMSADDDSAYRSTQRRISNQNTWPIAERLHNKNRGVRKRARRQFANRRMTRR